MTRSSSVASAVLLLVIGLWLLLQTLVGDLPGRLLSWRNYQQPLDAAPSTPSARGESGLEPGSGYADGGGGGGRGGHW